MVHIAGAVMIDAPVEDVFDLVADERNEPKYNPRIVRAEKLDEGPVGRGARFVAEPKGMGARGAMTIEIKEYDRPHRLHNVVRSSYMHIDEGLTLDPVDGGTWLRWSGIWPWWARCGCCHRSFPSSDRAGSVATGWDSSSTWSPAGTEPEFGVDLGNCPGGPLSVEVVASDGSQVVQGDGMIPPPPGQPKENEQPPHGRRDGAGRRRGSSGEGTRPTVAA
jgi:hypothetical protein